MGADQHTAPVPDNRRHLLPWFDLADWWADPRLAYAKGLADGYELGHDAANAELVTALAQALGGPDCTDYRTGLRRHRRAVDARTRRQAFDQHTTDRDTRTPTTDARRHKGVAA